MDILPLLDELQIIARNCLHYAQNPYDRERYERLMELTTRYNGEALDLPPADVRERLPKELGYVTPKVKADAAIFNAAGEILLVLRANVRCTPNQIFTSALPVPNDGYPIKAEPHPDQYLEDILPQLVTEP